MTIPLAHSESLMPLLPGAKLTIIDNAGHIAHLEQPEIFNSLLLQFLAH